MSLILSFPNLSWLWQLSQRARISSSSQGKASLSSARLKTRWETILCPITARKPAIQMTGRYLRSSLPRLITSHGLSMNKAALKMIYMKFGKSHRTAAVPALRYLRAAGSMTRVIRKNTEISMAAPIKNHV